MVQRHTLIPVRPSEDIAPPDDQNMHALQHKHVGPLVAINLGEITDTVRQGKWLILFCCLCAVGLLFAYEYAKKPTFRASSHVTFALATPERENSRLLGYHSALDRSRADEITFLQNSGALGRRVGLRLLQTTEAMRSTELFPVLMPLEDGTPPTMDIVGKRILDNAVFAPVGADMISISFVSPSPVEAVRLAELYAQEYQKMEFELSSQRIVTSKKFLKEQLEIRRTQQAELQDRWEQMLASPLGRLGSPANDALVTRYAHLKTTLEKVQIKLDEEVKLREITTSEFQRILNVDAAVLQELEPEIEWRGALKRLVKAQLDTDLYILEFGDAESDLETEDPDLQAALERIEGLKVRWQTINQSHLDRIGQVVLTENAVPETAQYADQLRNRRVERNLRIAEYELLMEGLQNRLAKTETELSQLPGQRLELSQLEKERAVVENWYKNIQKELRVYELAEQSQIGHVMLVDEIPEPMIERADLSTNIFISLALALFIGLGLAFIRRAFLTKKSLVHYY